MNGPPHGFHMDDLGHSFNQARGVLVRVQRALHPGYCPRVGPSSRAAGAVSKPYCVASHDQTVCYCLRELAPAPAHENEHHPNVQSTPAQARSEALRHLFLSPWH